MVCGKLVVNLLGLWPTSDRVRCHRPWSSDPARRQLHPVRASPAHLLTPIPVRNWHGQSGQAEVGLTLGLATHAIYYQNLTQTGGKNCGQVSSLCPALLLHPLRHQVLVIPRPSAPIRGGLILQVLIRRRCRRLARATSAPSLGPTLRSDQALTQGTAFNLVPMVLLLAVT